MRVYPHNLRKRTKVNVDPDAEPATTEPAVATAAMAAAGKPIISVNGRDIPEDEIDNAA
jgi:hypothetical protein